MKMVKHKIIIPDEVKVGALIQCLIDPPVFEPEFTFTVKGEDVPFQSGKLTKKRVNEIGAFMFRPRRLDEVKKKFTDPLKPGDEIIVKISIKGKDGIQEQEGTVTLI